MRFSEDKQIFLSNTHVCGSKSQHHTGWHQNEKRHVGVTNDGTTQAGADSHAQDVGNAVQNASPTVGRSEAEPSLGGV